MGIAKPWEPAPRGWRFPDSSDKRNSSYKSFANKQQIKIRGVIGYTHLLYRPGHEPFVPGVGAPHGTTWEDAARSKQATCADLYIDGLG